MNSIAFTYHSYYEESIHEESIAESIHSREQCGENRVKREKTILNEKMFLFKSLREENEYEKQNLNS